MTSVFGADGKNVPCTVIEAGPCVVTQLKTVEKDGYQAVQVGFKQKSEKHTNKAEAGHFKAAGVNPMRYLAEFDGFDQETPWFRWSRSIYSRSGRPSSCTGFSRCLCLSEPHLPGYTYGRPHGSRPRNRTKPRSFESNPRVQPYHG